MASALSTFTDFIDTTGPSFLTSAEDVVNEACKNNYLLRRFLRGQGPSETVQGGSSIKDTIMFDEESTFQYYEPNQTFTWENPQVVENWEIQWRFCVDHMAYTDAEVELNVGTGMSRAARHTAYKRLKRIKEQRLWTSILNGMEDAIAFEFRDQIRSEAESAKTNLRNLRKNGAPSRPTGATPPEPEISSEEMEDKILELLESDAPDRVQRARLLSGR